MTKSIFLFLLLLVLILPDLPAQNRTQVTIVPVTVFPLADSPTGRPDSTFGDFTEITPQDSVFLTPPDEDFWIVTTAAADYDNDNDLDIAVLGYYVVYNVSAVDRLLLMRNDGSAGPDEWNFTYFNVPLGSLIAGSSDMAWGDADADGDLDLAVGSDGETVIYRNDSGMLVTTGTPLPGYWEENSQAYFDLRSLSWADFDNDGDQDLLIPSVADFGTFSYYTAMMRNDGPNGSGGWIFSEYDSLFAPTMHAQSIWADADEDGDLDLLLVNEAPLTDEGFIRKYTNQGNGSFTGEDLLGSLGIEHGEAQWGDYDSDGDLDILVAGNIKELNGTYTPMSLRIYRNDNETYIPVEVIPDPYAAGWFDFTAATWADYDSDGDMDILLAGHYNSGTQIEGRARIYLNNNGLFTDSGNELPAPHASGSHGGAFSWLDLDNDGDLDYFIAGEYFVPGGNGLIEAQMHLYRNDASGLNNPPLLPSGLSVTQLSANSVKLSWLPGSDDHTPASALTYELKLFRDNAPVTVPIHTPEPGNVSSVTEWILTGLENGDYTWTLSTVDASYIAGPFATGGFGLYPLSAGGAGDEKGYSLGQNAPNPSDQETTMTFTIPAAEMVSLELFDFTGKKVAHCADGFMEAGRHSVTVKTGDLPSGVYCLKLEAGNVVLSKKLVVSHR